MMVVFEKKEECAGCTACLNICPHSAITMHPDKKGFLYPVIDEKLCTECGLCHKICPFREGFKLSDNLEKPLVYAVKHKDDTIRLNSSSGGMFTAISDFILRNEGVVYGAAFDEHFRVYHQKAENAEERDKLRGSKYVQSELNGVFADIKKELKKGRMVLFTGTPCQNAGLQAYLNKRYKNLFLCDMVCHGTPSPLIYDEYISFMQNEYNSRIKTLTFRSKFFDGNSMAIKMNFVSGEEYIMPATRDIFYRLFFQNVILRESCYHCVFTNFLRPSDITIADFWGVEKSIPDIQDDKGISLVLVNSSKGRDLFQNISEQVEYWESNTSDCLQHNLHSPSQPSPNYKIFWQYYENRGFEYVVKTYRGFQFKVRIKFFIRDSLEKQGMLPFVKRLLSRK